MDVATCAVCAALPVLLGLEVDSPSHPSHGQPRVQTNAAPRSNGSCAFDRAGVKPNSHPLRRGTAVLTHWPRGVSTPAQSELAFYWICEAVTGSKGSTQMHSGTTGLIPRVPVFGTPNRPDYAHGPAHDERGNYD